MKQYQRVIKTLRCADEVGLPPDPKFFERLHAKIMNQVEEIEMEPPPLWLRSKKYLQTHWKSWFHTNEWKESSGHIIVKTRSVNTPFLKSSRK